MGAEPLAVQRWDIFCRVVDNHGDLGFCWRLARGLAAAGQRPRLWVDDAAALAWMAPTGEPGVECHHWPADAHAAFPPPGDVVVEAFGCDPPPAFVAAMAAAAAAPVWINLEYLSAEPYVARSHGLRSPQMAGPGRGLDKWFFYPGFTEGTGGLLHGDRASLDAPALPHRAAWATELGLALPAAAAPDERLALLFGYPQGPWPALLHGLGGALPQPTPWRVLVPPGGLQGRLEHAPPTLPAGMAWQPIAAVPQPDFDRLLAGCDLVVVRGEDSFVRAQLAGDAPFLWQIYPQDDSAHAAKLDAFLGLYLEGAEPGLAASVARLFRALNGLAAWPGPDQAWPDWPAWQSHQRAWRRAQLARPDLLRSLMAFAALRRLPSAT